MNRSLWFRLPITAVVISVLAAIMVGMIGLVSGWGTVDYSNGMFIAGGVAIGVAILSSFGRWDNQADSKQMYSQSPGEMSLTERTRLWVHDMTQGFNAVLLMFLIGMLLIGLSVLIGSYLD